MDSAAGRQPSRAAGEALDATLGVEERLVRLADVVVPVPGDSCTRLLMGRRDPAWLWYGIAAAAVLAVLILELTGVLGQLGP